MIRRPPRSTLSSSSAASDVYKRQSLVREVSRAGAGVFLDLKLHDIPNTVARAAAAAVRTGATIVNCPAAGGAEMMKAFGEGGRAAAAKAGLPAPKLIAVTVLTSLDAAAVHAVGLTGSPREHRESER